MKCMIYITVIQLGLTVCPTLMRLIPNHRVQVINSTRSSHMHPDCEYSTYCKTWQLFANSALCLLRWFTFLFNVMEIWLLFQPRKEQNYDFFSSKRTLVWYGGLVALVNRGHAAPQWQSDWWISLSSLYNTNQTWHMPRSRSLHLQG